ncbi:ABC transporter ATP-binding protein [Nocardioides sp. LHD-245]|uniref:ABC transporter ATP-binding protein n=1 Tax=Nocardioides sp. LHD-245 TaxID=3051387 RepID=UPI0027E03608|nr:ABC transporter ATP-binding protein [Nocardioides sp. LHD-245]
MSMLSITDMYAGYGAGDVLDGVSLHVDAGEVVVVLGANGAGKTTLMRAVAGLISRRGGIELDGESIARAATDAIVRRGLALVPQGRGTIVDLTVEENLRAGAHVRRGRGLAEDLDRWYTQYPRLADRRKQKAGLLSGGEQQMLAIARAMMSRPRVLLCDEPSLGLSPLLTEELFESLRQINTDLGMAILVVEQNAMIALEIADRGYLLEIGEISESRPAAELAADDAVRAAYLGA